MNINRLRQELHEMIDACSDKDLLDHFFHVLEMGKAAHSQGFSMDFKSGTHPGFSFDLENLEDFEPFEESEDPLDYPEFEGGLN